MGQAVQRRSREPLATEHLGPVLEWQVGGHDQAVSLVAVAITSNSSSAPALLAGNVAQFVEDQQIQLAKLLPEPQELTFFLASRSRVMSSVTRKKRTLRPLSASGHSQRRGQVGLACTAGTDEQNVLSLVEILAFDELQKQWLVDAGAGLKVELIE